MVLCVHGPCTETVRALAGFKLSARGVQLSTRGVQTQHAVPPPAVHCPPNPQCHLPRPVASPSCHPRRLRPCLSPVALAPHLPCPLASPSRRPRRLRPCRSLLARLPCPLPASPA